MSGDVTNAIAHTLLVSVREIRCHCAGRAVQKVTAHKFRFR